MPASVSTLSVFSSCQEILRRVGIRMIAAAPYALHWLPAASSFAGSHSLITRLAAWLTGMLAESPLSGVTIRQRQSSVTSETQLPVRSIGAPSLGDRGGCGGPPRCADSVTADANASSRATVLESPKRRVIVRAPGKSIPRTGPPSRNSPA